MRVWSLVWFLDALIFRHLILLHILLLDFANRIYSLFHIWIATAGGRALWSALLKYLDKNIIFRSNSTFCMFITGGEKSSSPSLCNASHIFCFPQIQNENTLLNSSISNTAEMAAAPFHLLAVVWLTAASFAFFHVILTHCPKLVPSSRAPIS